MVTRQQRLQFVHLFLGLVDALLEGDQVKPGQLLVADLVALDAAVQERKGSAAGADEGKEEIPCLRRWALRSFCART